MRPSIRSRRTMLEVPEPYGFSNALRSDNIKLPYELDDEVAMWLDESQVSVLSATNTELKRFVESRRLSQLIKLWNPCFGPEISEESNRSDILQAWKNIQVRCDNAVVSGDFMHLLMKLTGKKFTELKEMKPKTFELPIVHPDHNKRTVLMKFLQAIKVGKSKLKWEDLDADEFTNLVITTWVKLGPMVRESVLQETPPPFVLMRLTGQSLGNVEQMTLKEKCKILEGYAWFRQLLEWAMGLTELSNKVAYKVLTCEVYPKVTNKTELETFVRNFKTIEDHTLAFGGNNTSATPMTPQYAIAPHPSDLSKVLWTAWVGDNNKEHEESLRLAKPINSCVVLRVASSHAHVKQIIAKALGFGAKDKPNLVRKAN